MPQILITGCSSGFGLAIAARFLDDGWDVVVTMQTPSTEGLPRSDRLRVLPLDVTLQGSIDDALAEAGRIDVLVYNAGVVMLNVLEGVDNAKARELFETSAIGTKAMTRAVMPAMRELRAGVIVNIRSCVTQRPLPALSIYSASKGAVNTFSESLALEAAGFGVRVRTVLPGSAPQTSFGKNAVARMGMDVPEAYGPFVQTCFQALPNATEKTEASDVAYAVCRAATDPDPPIMQPAGKDARTLFQQSRRIAG
ncbi:SDR family NAD(P)-dependent oxidoreductase [Paracoccus liaowanqingii]|uniref:SDR family NAD(P)-dependent oxidoreductase n=1 Tax=Paracoccus liaowanqingii TaxID=2560053 RepID=A0A4Z1C8F7_9RHOB|nr:SDR family NAD(P)-dependent oxidoreductase [Paracoccus liaowanqingii]TGN50849.1 SDR family NAD(P)-dependent oxidoreductase [Paracoccus liaowanqingii]